MCSVWLDLMRRWALWLILLEILLMLSATVRRSLLSLLAVSTVGTLGFSAAATLSVDSNDLGAGDSVVAACAPAGLQVSYVPIYYPDASVITTVAGTRYFVQDVVLAENTLGELANCSDQDYSITFIDATGAAIATVSDTFGTIATSESIDVTPATPGDSLVGGIPAEDVEHIAIVISEPAV